MPDFPTRNFPAPTGRLVLTLPMNGNRNDAVEVYEQDDAFVTYSASGDLLGVSKSASTAFSAAFASAAWSVRARPATRKDYN